MTRCNFLHGCKYASVALALGIVAVFGFWVDQDRVSACWRQVGLVSHSIVQGPMTEPEWVDYIAVQSFGLPEVDGRIAGVEVSLFNGKRVDIVWREYAIEADWANKAPEGIGQSLYYAAVTHRKPGLLLLLKKSSDVRYVEQALVVCRRNVPEIRVWAYDTRARKFLQVSDGP